MIPQYFKTKNLYINDWSVKMIIDAHLHLPVYDDSLKTFKNKKDKLLEDLSKAGVNGAIVISDSEMFSIIGTPEIVLSCFQTQTISSLWVVLAL